MLDRVDPSRESFGLLPILHVDMDAFFASIEQRDHPAYRGKPVIVGSPPDRRGVVSAASYEARRFGVRSAMPSREAGRRCPQGIFVRPRMDVYRQTSELMFDILQEFTPVVEPVSVDEAFLDVSGSVYLFGPPDTIARSIRQAIRERLHLTASVGVAPNKFVAKLASDMNKPDGLTVTPSDPELLKAWLAPLGIERMWGVGPRTAGVLKSAGIRTLGDLQAVRRDRLRSLVGEALADHLLPLSLGQDSRPVCAHGPEKSLSREHTFDSDTADVSALLPCLVSLVESVGARLRRSGRFARVAHLKVRDAAFKTRTRQAQLPVPTASDAELIRMARDLWARTWGGGTVRLIGFGVSDLQEPGDRLFQPDLFAGPAPDARDDARLDEAVDRVRTRFGRGALRRGSSLPPPPA